MTSARILRRGAIAASRSGVAAAITPTLLTSGTNTASPACLTASVSPVANRLLLLAVHVTNSNSVTPANLVSVTGNSLTWVRANSIVTDATGMVRGRVFIYRALGAVPSSGVITMTAAEAGTSRFSWVLTQFANADTSGTDGSGAIVQQWGASGTSNTPTVTLQSAFGSPANATFGACGHGDLSGATFVPSAGYTEIAESGSTSTPQAFCAVQFRPDNDTIVDGTLTDGSLGWGILPIEIKAA